ncbi:uncharacterized protein BO87DRAFT_392109 [Aspergillus neoniger CBS 115656]|uniref:Uncharacterized protein n=1 Tax=Aspergillus neoniger (strain CBS 115656) TaxID=1448310 RepID=A0A318Y364_ASPNB|nr:hypothetical protein BO87DRAFT_392109 [Aspergillus neoniger CBS 115656]PYH28194.1 hypothetical protein BO87DRAFT_392109 [Aspergillus neoniger CBS 115656]
MIINDLSAVKLVEGVRVVLKLEVLYASWRRTYALSVELQFWKCAAGLALYIVLRTTIRVICVLVEWVEYYYHQHEQPVYVCFHLHPRDKELVLLEEYICPEAGPMCPDFMSLAWPLSLGTALDMLISNGSLDGVIIAVEAFLPAKPRIVAI